MNMATKPKPSGKRMIRREFVIRFDTPAFVGDASQNGRWRTPPFKHLLREWWRVAFAGERDFPADVLQMRREEGHLFGDAADGAGNRSLVRIRLGRWDKGKEKPWGSDPKVRHPEVGKNGVAVGAHLYLGYGPLSYDKKTKGTNLKSNVAIQAGESAELRIAFPEEHAALLGQVLGLMSTFGAVGGRSRNGWGSFTLLGAEGQPVTVERLPLRSWNECLELEWAHAIGEDGRGALIWRTEAFSDWRKLMQELARIKIALRTRFQFRSGRNAPRPEDRHWLSYPVTNHSVRDWGNSRLPNTLRFKVRKNGQGRYYGVIFHMPCKPPADFSPDSAALLRVWSSVHGFLDGYGGLQRGW